MVVLAWLPMSFPWPSPCKVTLPFCLSEAFLKGQTFQGSLCYAKCKVHKVEVKQSFMHFCFSALNDEKEQRL